MKPTRPAAPAFRWGNQTRLTQPALWVQGASLTDLPVLPFLRCSIRALKMFTCRRSLRLRGGGIVRSLRLRGGGIVPRYGEIFTRSELRGATRDGMARLTV